MSPKLKVYAMVLGIFVLGAGAGGAAGYTVANKQLAEFLGGGRPGIGDARRLAAIAKELDLDRDQRRRVREIMERHREENRQLMDSMFERCGDDLLALRTRVDREIGVVLTPDQARRFHELMAKRGQRYPLGVPPPRPRHDH